MTRRAGSRMAWSDPDDRVAADRDIRAEPRIPGSVDDAAASDHDVVRLGRGLQRHETEQPEKGEDDHRRSISKYRSGVPLYFTRPRSRKPQEM